jgi:hypothetical protein
MSRFKQGESGNPGGRPKGSKNLTSREVKELVLGVLEKNFSGRKIASDLRELSGKQRIDVFLRLAQLVLPHETDFKIDYSQLTDKQMDEMLDKILAKNETTG